MKRTRKRQLELEFRTWGGARRGAGRKAAPENVGLLAHVRRADFTPRNPVHITLRALPGVPRMREEVVARIVLEEIGRASAKGLSVLHFSVQQNHLHLIVEAKTGEALSRGMQRLASRIAMRINRLVNRRGRFWRERYHRQDLTSVRQFRHALVYVVFNHRKHAPARRLELDPLSSMRWFADRDWAPHDDSFLERFRGWRARAGPAPVVAPQTWYARTGWRRLGAIDPREIPKTR